MTNEYSLEAVILKLSSALFLLIFYRYVHILYIFKTKNNEIERLHIYTNTCVPKKLSIFSA